MWLNGRKLITNEFLLKCCHNKLMHWHMVSPISKLQTKHFSESVFSKKYNEENLTKILEVLNSGGIEDLTRLKLSRARSANILSYRLKNGYFDKIDDVLSVDGFDITSLTKLCNKIVKNENVDQSKLLKIQRQLLSPALQNAEKINTAVGIHIGANSVSWAQLENDSTLLCDWNMFSLEDINSKKITLNDILLMSLEVLKKIPAADLYIFESFPLATPSSQQQLLSLLAKQKVMQLNCILVTLLSTSPSHNKTSIFHNLQSENSHDVSNVHFLRSRIPARLFRTLVGNENVSAEATISKIISGANEEFCGPVTVPEKFKLLYENSPAVEKEILGQALMLILSFMNLCVYQNIKSLKAISPGVKKNG